MQRNRSQRYSKKSQTFSRIEFWLDMLFTTISRFAPIRLIFFLSLPATFYSFIPSFVDSILSFILFQALLLSHPHSQTRDTQLCAAKHKLVKSKKPALRHLVKQELNMTIQDGEHSSVRLLHFFLKLFCSPFCFSFLLLLSQSLPDILLLLLLVLGSLSNVFSLNLYSWV